MAKHNYVSPKQVKPTDAIRHGGNTGDSVKRDMVSGLTNPSNIGESGNDESIASESAERKNIGAAAFQKVEASEGDSRYGGVKPTKTGKKTL